MRTQTTPVFLYVYHHRPLKTVNRLMKLLGSKVGAYHVGVIAHDIEFCYGAGNTSEFDSMFVQLVDFNNIRVTTSSGIVGHKPRQGVVAEDPIAVHKLGESKLSLNEVLEGLKTVLHFWQAADYDLLYNNCIHFADYFAVEILGVCGVPAYVNALGRNLGRLMNNGSRQEHRYRTRCSRNSSVSREGSSYDSHGYKVLINGVPKNNLNYGNRTKMPPVSSSFYMNQKFKNNFNTNLNNDNTSENIFYDSVDGKLSGSSNASTTESMDDLNDDLMVSRSLTTPYQMIRHRNASPVQLHSNLNSSFIMFQRSDSIHLSHTVKSITFSNFENLKRLNSSFL